MASFRSFRRRSLNFFPSKSFRREFSVETLSWQPLPRSASLARLAREEFDVVVVGGGCVGAGVAWEASTRGLKVALLEQGDFSSGTSSRSTKLIHGGIRYLESAFKNLDKGMYDLVTEALDEVREWLKAPPAFSFYFVSSLPMISIADSMPPSFDLPPHPRSVRTCSTQRLTWRSPWPPSCPSPPGGRYPMCGWAQRFTMP